MPLRVTLMRSGSLKIEVQPHLSDKGAKLRGKPSCEVPLCERSGHFQKKQCCDITKQCRCVDPVTGQTTVQPQSDPNVRCP
ncbi:hypothetical protein AVEN_112018-1 [Araneus ventricosus]|uniref:Thyroglobulin type-1 domain-containing protein n=1 Tax=Araneus ventricosus TaxID=182803 RepID=A0A4Y2ULI7_ARAVE|nr:hypothetical protein AVEN_112018-1 [Araneus ventricosus]